MTSKAVMNQKVRNTDKVEFWGRYNPIVVKKKIMGILLGLLRYALLISLGFVILTPIFSTFKQGITAHNTLGLKNSVWIPPAVSRHSFVVAFQVLKYNQALLFSILNTALLAFLQTICAAIAAYSFSRLKFKGSGILFGLVLFTIIVPAQSIMLSQYITFRNFDIFGLVELITGNKINMIGSTGAIYVLAATGMGVKGGLYIYILRQSYRQLPIAIEEAAYVDGAGFLKTFVKIVLPGVSSALTTVGVLSFVWNYADVYYISLLSPTNLHLSLRLSRIQANMRWAIGDVEKLLPTSYVIQKDSPVVQMAIAAACAILVILPLLIMYLFIQKRFVQGVERSGLGGD